MKDLRVSFPEPCGERWDDMAPRGCNRHCASCDRIIHDLSAMTIEQVEELVANEPEPCVRARISPGGLIATQSPTSTSRRMSVALGTGAALALAACHSVAPNELGSIRGRVIVGEDSFDPTIKIRNENGQVYRARLRQDGTFEIKGLRAGSYSITLSEPACQLGNLKKVDDVEINGDEVEIAPIDWSPSCAIYIGMMKVEGHDG